MWSLQSADDAPRNSRLFRGVIMSPSKTTCLKKNILFVAASLTLVTMSAPVIAGPAINVGALNEYVYSGKNTLAKRIYNTGDATAFVRVTVSEIVYKGQAPAEEVPLDNEAIIDGKGSGIISSPPRLIIPAGGMQTNRLVITGPRDKEAYYRVRYIPVMPKNMDEFALNKDEINKYQSTINASVAVMTGFGTIVTVQPDKVHFDTQITEKGNTLRISNNGNASVVIAGLKSCDINLKNCNAPANIQLRPGRSLERDIVPQKIWHYTLTEGSQKKTLKSGL